MYAVVRTTACDKDEYNIQFEYIVVSLDPKGTAFNTLTSNFKLFVDELIVPPTNKEFMMAPIFTTNAVDRDIKHLVRGTCCKDRKQNVVAGFSVIDDAIAFCKTRNKCCEIDYVYTVQHYDPETNTVQDIQYKFRSYYGIPDHVLMILGRTVAGVQESVHYEYEDKIKELKEEANNGN